MEEREADRMNPIATLYWTGWQRLPRGRWRAVVQAESEAACWRLLLDRTGGGEKAVLLTGRHPRHRRQRVNRAGKCRMMTPESD
jgi:hypothetical protein